MDIYSLTPEYFRWAVQGMADMTIRLAKQPPAPPENRWNRFLGGRVPR
jgi:hypothetical protein